MARIFISYAREDEDQARALYRVLKKLGYEPWLDQEDILAGEDWALSIARAIRHADFFIACLSRQSVEKRGYMRVEWKNARKIWQEKLDSDIYLIPVRFEDCETPDELRELHWVNLYEIDGMDRLDKALKAGIARYEGKTPSPAQVEPVVDVIVVRQKIAALIEAYRQRIHNLRVRIAMEGLDAHPLDAKEKEKLEGTVLELEKQMGLTRFTPAQIQDLEIALRETTKINQTPLDIHAAFENREDELRAILDVWAKPFIFISAPAGFGKTYLLDEVERRLGGARRGWIIARHNCISTDTESTVLGNLAQEMGVAVQQSINTIPDLINVMPMVLTAANAEGLVVQFDSIEQWKQDGRWSPIALFVRDVFAATVSRSMSTSRRKFKILFAGRYINDLRAGFNLPSDEVNLSFFDARVIRVYIYDTMQRFELVSVTNRGEIPEQIDGIVEAIVEISGGHPRAVTRFVQDLVEREFLLDPLAYSHFDNQKKLFERFVAGEIETLLRGVAQPLQDVFRVLSVFRGFNSDTLNALLDARRLSRADWRDGWLLYQQVLQTHLIRQSVPLSHDMVLQRVLDAQKRYSDPVQYRQMHEFAMRLYDGWLVGEDHQGKPLGNRQLSGSDQIKLMLESLYHTCRLWSEHPDGKRHLNEKIGFLLPLMRFPSVIEEGRKTLRDKIDADAQLRSLLVKILGLEYAVWLERISASMMDGGTHG